MIVFKKESNILHHTFEVLRHSCCGHFVWVPVKNQGQTLKRWTLENCRKHKSCIGLVDFYLTRSWSHGWRLLQRFKKSKRLKNSNNLCSCGGRRGGLKVVEDLSGRVLVISFYFFFTNSYIYIFSCVYMKWTLPLEELIGLEAIQGAHLYFPSLRPLFKLKLQHMPESVGVACRVHHHFWANRVSCEIQSCWHKRQVTLNKEEQLICWLFQKHSLMTASWNPSDQDFLGQNYLGRMSTRDDRCP